MVPSPIFLLVTGRAFRAANRLETVSLRVLADRKHVAVRVFERGYLVAVGSGPDSQFAILHEGILLESHASPRKPARDGSDVTHLPAHHGVRSGSEVRSLCNPDHGFAGTHYQSKLVIADELETKFVLVKGPGFLRIFGGDEADKLVFGEHCLRLGERRTAHLQIRGGSRNLGAGNLTNRLAAVNVPG